MRRVPKPIADFALVLISAAGEAFGQVTYSPSYTFSTLAGSAPGSVDGAGAGARFGAPSGIACDIAGTVYVADPPNHVIRKITSDGAATTLAGMPGVFGSPNGTGSAARFYYPSGLAVNSAGDVFVADTYNNEIRKITPDGQVTTFAGSAKFDISGNPIGGHADGTGAAASFNSPYGVAIDASNNLYISDYGNDLVRVITPSAQVTTLAGHPNQGGSADGTGTNALFYQPEGLAVDMLGDIFVADMGNSTIRKLTSGGVVTTIAGLAGHPGSVDGTGTAARLSLPSGIAADGAGNLYVADNGNATIRRLSPVGSVYTVTNLAGLAGAAGVVDGTNTTARFTHPSAVALGTNANLYVADQNSTIRVVSLAGVVTSFAGQASGSGAVDGTGSAARFDHPSGIAVDGGGTVYVADTGNFTIRKITSSGVVTTYAGLAHSSGNANGSLANARFYQALGMALDSGGNLYVADGFTIRKITAAGVVSKLAGETYGYLDGTGSAAEFAEPCSLAVDTNGNVYVADHTIAAIRKVTPAGVVTTLPGWTGAAALDYPSGVAVDTNGNIYVADTDNSRIQKSTSSGVVTTLAGLNGVSGNVDGAGSAARFYRPSAVALDGAGNVYVADQNNSIRMVTKTGVVTTLGGLAQLDLLPGGENGGEFLAGSTDGPGNVARFNSILALAADTNGAIYVADTGNNVIRKGVPLSSLLVVLGVEPGGGFTAGQFGFSLSGPTGQSVVVEASDDLVNWLAISTNTIAGASRFSDSSSASLTNRFYRTIAQ